MLVQALITVYKTAHGTCELQFPLAFSPLSANGESEKVKDITLFR